MADNPQTLLEFSDNVLSDLSRGAITAQEAMAACQQYAYWREAFSSRSSELTQATLTGDEELTAAVSAVIEAAAETLKTLPSFHEQPPDAPSEEETVRNAAFLRATAIDRIEKHTQRKLAPYKERRREFIHDLVTKFSSTVPVAENKEFAGTVDRALVAAAGEATSTKTKERFAELLAAAGEQYAATPLSADQKALLKNAIKETLTGNDAYVHDATEAYRKERAVIDIVYKNMGGFFSHHTAKGVSQGIQQAADGILSVVGEPVRDIVYKNKVDGVFRKMLSDTQTLTDRLGETFVRSAFFTQVTQSLTKSLGERPQTSGAGSVVGDIFSTVFRGPLSPALVTATRERMFDYLELSRASANAPKGHTFMNPGVLPWNVFSLYPQPFNVDASARHMSFGRRLLYGPLSSLGFWTGNALSSTVDRTTSFFFANPSLPIALNRFRRAQDAPTPFFEDMPRLVALSVVTTLILLFLFPGPFNSSFLSYSAKAGALLDSLYQKGMGGGPDDGTVVDCTQTPSDPLCSFKACTGDCSWPSSGAITQGPNVECDTETSHHSGSDANGIDIAASGNVPVYAVRSGTVVAIHNTCVDNSGKLEDWRTSCGQGYGNYVTVLTDDGYTIIYGHLRSAINPELTEGGPVAAHDQIGWMDQTGNSSGQHLHFGVLSGGNVLDLVPDSPFDKNDIYGCVASWLSPSCNNAGKSCPAGSVSAQ